VEYVIIALLQIVCRVCQLKNFENRSIIGEDIDKSKVPRFFAHPVECAAPSELTNVATRHTINNLFVHHKVKKPEIVACGGPILWEPLFD